MKKPAEPTPEEKTLAKNLHDMIGMGQGKEWEIALLAQALADTAQRAWDDACEEYC